ncbi:MAG: caspase family protein [Leptospirillum sp.]|jgi:hypothetical protein
MPGVFHRDLFKKLLQGGILVFFLLLSACGIPPTIDPFTTDYTQTVSVPAPETLVNNYFDDVSHQHPDWSIRPSFSSKGDSRTHVQLSVWSKQLKHNDGDMTFTNSQLQSCKSWFLLTYAFESGCGGSMGFGMFALLTGDFLVGSVIDIPLLFVYPFSYSSVMAPDPSATKDLARNIRKAFSPKTFADKLDSLSEQDRIRLSRGDLLLGKLPYRISSYLAPISEIDKSTVESFLLYRDMNYLAGKKPELPSRPTAPEAPELTQDAYESTAHFNERVAQAKLRYKEQIQTYYQKIGKYRLALDEYRKNLLARRQKMLEYPLWRKNAIREMALNAEYGRNLVQDTKYNPDANLFSLKIESLGGATEQIGTALPPTSFILTKKIPNDRAPQFDKKLKESHPIIHFTIKGHRLELESATLTVSGKDYTALPSDQEIQTTRQSIRLEPLNVVMDSLPSIDEPQGKISSLSDMKIVYASNNPEIKTLLKKIRKKEAENSDQSEIEALKWQLARLQAQTHPLIHYYSPVDHPSFQLLKHQSWYAVVVGVEQYPKGIPPAEFSDRDAQAVKANLIALGYPVSHIRILTDEQATNSRIKATLKRWLPRNVPKGGRVLFYFAGHGGTDSTSKTAYLVPFDGDPEDLADTALSVGEVEKEIGKLPLSQGIIVADACFSGAGGRSLLAQGTRPLLTIIRTPYKTPYRNLMVFGASRGNQISGDLPKEGHGIFTYYFLRGLEGKAKTGKTVTTRSLKRYLSRTVPLAFRQYYNSGEQNPVVSGDMNGILVKY